MGGLLYFSIMSILGLVTLPQSVIDTFVRVNDQIYGRTDFGVAWMPAAFRGLGIRPICENDWAYHTKGELI